MKNPTIVNECHPPPDNELEEIYERGYNLWNDGFFEQATECFAEAAIHHPLERRFLFAFACALKQQGETEQALKLFMHCIFLQADEPWAYFHIAGCLNTLGNITEACDALESTLTLCRSLNNDAASHHWLHQQAKSLLADLSY